MIYQRFGSYGFFYIIKEANPKFITIYEKSALLIFRKKKECEKLEKYQKLREELKKNATNETPVVVVATFGILISKLN